MCILVQRHNWGIFFENEQGNSVTVNGNRYQAMLNEYLFTEIEEEATCHTAEATLHVLHPVFEDRIISRRSDTVWPPRSCDLTPLDYYLWGRQSITPISQTQLTL